MTAFFIGLSEIPFSRGSIESLATNATNSFSFNIFLMYSWSNTKTICSFKASFFKLSYIIDFSTILGNCSKIIFCAAFPIIRLPLAGIPISNLTSILSSFIKTDVLSKISCPHLSIKILPLPPVPELSFPFF